MAHESRDATATADRVDDRDWSALTLGQRIEQLEVEGYLVIPDLLDADLIAQLKEQTAQFETGCADYSVHQRVLLDVQFTGGAVTELIAHPPMISFLRKLFGDSVVFMDYDYARSEPGHPGISLHSDGQPWGSSFFGYDHSCPKLVRVLYYLDDLTPQVSPFLVVPRSQLSFHHDANPYLRYARHPGQVMVPCKAGSAVLLNQYVFHGNFPNVGTHVREMLAIAYRPAWSGPSGEIEAWDAKQLADVSPAVRELMTDRNQRIWSWEGKNKPDNMAVDARGIDPDRWRWT